MSTESILESFRYYTGEHSHARYNEINQANREIMKRSKYWITREIKEDLMTLKSGVYRYKVDFSCFRGSSPTHIYIRSNQTKIWSLITEVQGDSFEDKRPNDLNVIVESKHEYPTYYYLTGGSDFNFYVTPTPSIDTEIRFDGIKSIKSLERGVEPILPEDYHEAIALMAASFFFQQKADATQSDLNRALSLKERAESELMSLIEDLHPNRLEDLSWSAGPLLY